MYQAHFKLTSLPFSATTTPENTYQSAELTEALSHFYYAIENGDSLLLLTGEVGCGKTTAIQVALRQLRRKMSIAVVSHVTVTPRELLEAVVIGFNLHAEKRETKPQLIRRLENHFKSCCDAGSPPLIIFDEAHLLKPAVLEELRLLSNMTRDGETLVHIFLVGQPELAKRLQGNRSLRQRISVRYQLKPLSTEETGGYVAHRLQAAGCLEPSMIFSKEALAVVHRYSGGIPREINVIAGYAMLNCFLEDRYQVNENHVRAVATEYDFQGVTEIPEEREVPADLPVAEIANPRREATAVTREQPVDARPEDDEAEPHRVMFQMDSANESSAIRKLSSTKVLAVAVALVATVAVFVAWVIVDTTAQQGLPTTDSKYAAPNVESSLTATDSKHAAPSVEPSPSEPDAENPMGQTTEPMVKVAPPPDPAEVKALPVIRLDSELTNALNQPVTVQIASLLDAEEADRSLARVSDRTDIPGAVEVVTAGETTWYLVLLGYYPSVEEAETALEPVLPVLGAQAVTEVRIKPAPSWLQARLLEQVGTDGPQ